MRRPGCLAATAALAIGVPAGAAAWVGHRTHEVVDRLASAAGVPAQIGGVDGDLTGTIRLTDVALGDLVSADALEASVSLESILSGELHADEIRVVAPRVALAIDASGDSDLARLARKLAATGSPRGGGSRVRRIVVSSGSLVARIAGVGEVSADDVELVPDAGGVRVLTGPLRARGTAGPLAVELRFQRAAAELALPQMRFGRVLAVAGSGLILAGRRNLALHDVSVGRLRDGGALELGAFLDDRRGAHIALELAPRDFAVTLRGSAVPLGVLERIALPSIELADARATGTLSIRRNGQVIDVAVDGSFDGVRVDHPAVAASPVPLAASVRGALTLSPDSVAVKDADLVLGSTRWSFDGWLRRGAPLSGQLDLRLAPAACTALAASMPLELRGPLDGIALSGTLGAHAHLAIDLAAPDGAGVELSNELAGGCEVDHEPPAADVGVLAAQPHPAGWVALRELPPHVTGAFVAAEDARFWSHHGFDLEQIVRSLEIDLREHRLARGGSTISQQLIKNTFLSQRRSVDRKLQEAILTWRLEARLDKRAILERYLNIIELGPRIYGIGSAAKHWFGVAPGELSIRQAAFLAALTAEPTSMTRRLRRADGLDADSAARIDTVLRAMKRDGVIDKEQLAAAHNAPLRFQPVALPAEARRKK